jgi:hypothetical protein
VTIVLIARVILAAPSLLKLFIQISDEVSKQALKRKDTDRFESHSRLIGSLSLSDSEANPDEDS